MSRKPLYLVGFLLLVLSLATPIRAWAHEEVESGGYVFEIGWLSEPPVAGERNGLELFVAPHDDPEAGVEGITTLQFTVEYGGASQTYELEPAHDEPGHYSASFIPSVEGVYTFRLTGTIEGQTINVEVQPEEVVGMGQAAFPPGADLSAQVVAAEAAATGARTLALVGVVLGVIGIGLGGYGLMRRS